MDKQRFTELIDAYLSGKASAADKALLEAYYQKLAEEPEPVISKDREVELEDSMYQGICAAVDGMASPLVKRKASWKKWAAVAAVFLLCCTIALWWSAQQASRGADQVIENGALSLQQDTLIQPGGNKASLHVVGGASLELSEGEKGLEIGQQGLRYFDGDTLARADQIKLEAMSSLEVRTPRGGTYQLLLPDGTRVFLNAETVLQFPSRFSGEKRIVELIQGEAYFEVEKDAAHPFVVQMAEQEIEVLGTHFNVSHYADEADIKTTLAEGKVRIRTAHSAVVLQAGEQAIQHAQGLRVKKVDVASVLAWKDGLFIAEGQDFKSMMRAIARWYDVELSFENDRAFEDLYIAMQIARTRTLQEVLDRLESTGEVRFKLAGRRVRVMR